VDAVKRGPEGMEGNPGASRRRSLCSRNLLGDRGLDEPRPPGADGGPGTGVQGTGSYAFAHSRRCGACKVE
jgi:hypothetical protein